MSDIDSTPKWAREARDHLINLSARLDDTEAYVRSLEAVRDDLLAALEEMVSQYEEFFEDAIEPRGGAFDEYWNALDAIAKAKGE